MFIRAELKERAKLSIHKNIWLCMGVTFVALFASSDFFGIEVDPYTSETFFRMGLGTVGDISLDFIYLRASTTLITVISIIALLFTILVVNPLIVGHARYYIENRVESSSFETLFYAFKKEHYLNIVKIMLLREVYTLLWTLCFIIPGIIKAYEYYMIPYILAENPNMDSEDVFEITKSLTYGHKFDIFVLEMSFILWSLLSIVTLGIASFYVNAYTHATYCEAYYSLKDMAMEQGVIEPDVEVIEEVVEEEIDEVKVIENTEDNDHVE